MSRGAAKKVDVVVTNLIMKKALIFCSGVAAGARGGAGRRPGRGSARRRRRQGPRGGGRGGGPGLPPRAAHEETYASGSESENPSKGNAVAALVENVGAKYLEHADYFALNRLAEDHRKDSEVAFVVG